MGKGKMENIQLSFASSTSVMSTIFAPYCWSIRLSNSFDIRFPKSENKQIKLDNNKKNSICIEIMIIFTRKKWKWEKQAVKSNVNKREI